MEKDLKLFVWEDVLTDYTPGIAFALAETKEEAINLIIEKHQVDHKYFPDVFYKELLENEPDIYHSKCGFYLDGGA
jgi:hypothetical protein